jgi:hypothetical protein
LLSRTEQVEDIEMIYSADKFHFAKLIAKAWFQILQNMPLSQQE